MLEAKIWLFLGLMAAVAVGIPVVVRGMRRRSEARVARAFESLEHTGVVVEDVLDPNGRPQVRIWGTLDHPVSIDLRIARRRKILGQLGGAGTGPLDPEFDRRFRISSRAPECAALVVSPEIQHRLAHLGTVELRIGSFYSLLPPAYRQPGQTKAGRRLRSLWMIRAPLRKAPPPRSELVEVGRLLAKSVAKHCLPPGSPDTSEFETGASEGQWL